MYSPRHFILLFLFSVLVTLVGVSGYMVIEGWPFLDSLFMTIITMSTVGYSEVNGLTPGGRAFTILLIFMGVGLFFYIATVLVQFMVEGRIRRVLGRRKLEQKISKLKNHYVVCGYGRIGKVLCDRLAESGMDMVVIERDEKRLAQLDESGLLYVSGEATEEEKLKHANIEKAYGLAMALQSDADGVFVVLKARQLNPDIFIIARANLANSASTLLAAGANKVVSPHEIGARRMADAILRPTVTDFLDSTFADSGHDIQMEEMPIAENSVLAGLSLAESGIRRDFNLIIIAIKRSDSSMIFNPSFDTRILAGQTVVAVGQKDNLRKLGATLNAE